MVAQSPKRLLLHQSQRDGEDETDSQQTFFPRDGVTSPSCIRGRNLWARMHVISISFRHRAEAGGTGSGLAGLGCAFLNHLPLSKNMLSGLTRILIGWDCQGQEIRKRTCAIHSSFRCTTIILGAAQPSKLSEKLIDNIIHPLLYIVQ